MSIRKSRLSQMLVQSNEETPSQEYLDMEPETTVAQPTQVIETTPEPTDTAAIAYQEIQNQQDEENESDLNDTVDGMQDVTDQIQQANEEDEGLSAESAYMAGLAIESYAGRLGVEFDEFYNSLESIINDDNGRQKVSMEDLQISMEAPDNKTKDRLKRLVSLTLRNIKFSTTQAKLAANGLDKIVNQARSVKASGKAPTIEVKSKWVMKGDNPSTDVSGDFKEAAKDLHYMTSGFTKQAVKDVKHNFETYIGVLENLEGGEPLDDLLNKMVSTWKDPRSTLKGDPSAPYIGNKILFEDMEVKYKGKNPKALQLSKWGNLNYPVHSGFHSKKAYSEKTTNITALTPDQIADIGKALNVAAYDLAYVETLKQVFRDVGTVAAPYAFTEGAFSAIIFTSPAGLFLELAAIPFLAVKVKNRHKGTGGYENTFSTSMYGSFNKELDALKDALDTSGRLAIHTGIDATSTLAVIIRNFKRVAKASLAAYAKASTESLEEDEQQEQPMLVPQQDQGSGNIDYPNDNEPNQVPEEDNTAPVEEVVEHQETYQDQPAAHQDLNGPVWMNGNGGGAATAEPEASSEDNTPEEKLEQPAEEADAKADAEEDVAEAVQGAEADTKEESKDPALRHKHLEAKPFDSAATADQKILDGEKIPVGIQTPKVQTYQGSTESLISTTPYWFNA